MTASQHTISVSTLDLPELRPYRTLRRPSEHFEQGIFVAEGEKVVRRLLDSDLRIVSVLTTQEWMEKLALERLTRYEGTLPIFVADKQILQQIVGYNAHQGLMAIGRVPPQRSIDELISAIPSPHLIVALDGLRQAENVGVITRNCAAFGVDAIIAGETSCSPYLRRAVRNSMGTVFKLPIIHVGDLMESLQGLGTRYGTRILATDAHSHFPLSSANLTGNICIVLGNEDVGVSPDILYVSSERIAIPMEKETDSLNVGSASAVCLYEANRQRTARR
jgi:tRNA G18 (ribose-2'-O)-methylase SpoU